MIKVKKNEKQIIKEFVLLFNYKLGKYTNHLIRIENSVAIFNGTYRHGLLKGVSDFLFDYPSGDCHYRNLWIEFKANKNKQTKEQIEFQKNREAISSKYILVYTADDAVQEIIEYINARIIS